MNRKSIKCHSKQKDSSIFVLLLTLLLIACGGDSGTASGGSTKLSNADMEVDSYSQLPSCVEKREGKTAYVVDQEQGYVCQEGEWVEDDAGETNSSSSMKSSSSVKSSSSINASSEMVYQVEVVDPGNVKKGTMTDSRDGKTYKTVTIGSQTWMAENLAFNYEVNGASYGVYANPKCDSCGLYYFWSAAMDSAGTYSTDGKGCGYGKTCSPTYPVRGICPESWHLPTDNEWEMLYLAMGFSSYVQAKKYVFHRASASDAYGFSALPVGLSSNGNFYGVGDRAYFWSAMEYNNHLAYYWRVNGDSAILDYDSDTSKINGFSIRCLKN